ncbi:mitochondrial thiamine pyrophosphate carrier-like [Colias croceus]|uniref:mitochondrial thiamine pyrophosphate carrier-like n=1 Tax=Colias crocea TaxID=72248 RepID=UPI001E2807B1|nr:mitochondrial thiamine pyrophosphate carrier-like [Colias croceus]
MVGYSKDDAMTPNQKIIAGAVSGAVTRFVTQPLDVLKIRTQLEKKLSKRKQRTLFETSKKIFHEEGIFAFWHGHNLGQMHSILSTGSQFYVYELTTKYAFQSTDDPKYKRTIEFLCGICAGSCSATLVTPLEVIRVRQMLVKEQYRGFFNGARAVYRSGGPLAFFEGWAAGVLMLGPQVAITFSVFSFIQPIILDYLHKCTELCEQVKIYEHRPEHLLLASSIGALVSGFVSKVIMYPFDLAKRRLQIASHRTENKFYTPTTSRNLVKCSNLIQCISDTVKVEGFLGLYRGLQVTVYKALSTNIITFTSYELICYFLVK